MSVEWNSLSDEAKKPYLAQTELLKKRYADEMKVYREKKAKEAAAAPPVVVADKKSKKKGKAAPATETKLAEKKRPAKAQEKSKSA